MGLPFGEIGLKTGDTAVHRCGPETEPKGNVLRHSDFYIGTYSKSIGGVAANGKGIYRSRIAPDSGAFEAPVLVAACLNPSYLIRRADGRRLYAVAEDVAAAGAAISGFEITGDGGLKFLNSQPVNGDSPCHLALDPQGRFLASAQYGSGDVALFALTEDGFLAPASDWMRLTGKGRHETRQTGPHAHFVQFLGDGTRLAVADLGSDVLWDFRLDRHTGRILAQDAFGWPAPAGAGPRHFALTPDQRLLYLLNELDESISVLRFNDGKWHLLQCVTVHAVSDPAGGAGAAIRLSSCGRHLYASFRRQSEIVAYAAEASSGELNLIGRWPSGGDFPRDFALTPDETHLVVANQLSGNLTSLRRDPDSGALTPTGQVIQIGSPVCVAF